MNGYIKATACTDKRDVLLAIYNWYAAGGRNWTLIDESANWAAGTPANGDFFVLRRNTEWANGTAGQYPEICFAANDSAGSVTFGGAGATKYTVVARSYMVVFGADGGWDAVNNEFVSPSGLAERAQGTPTTTAETTNSAYLVDAPESLCWWSYSTANTSWYACLVGEIEPLDTAAEDPRPCYVGIGRLGSSSSTTYLWNSACGAAPNATRTGWVVAALDEVPNVRADTAGLSRAGKIVEQPLKIYDNSGSPGCLGFAYQFRRSSTSVLATTVTDDGTRAYFGGLSVPYN